MSVTITEISSNKFELNGIQYFKNYTPVVRGNYITVVNTYDARNVLVQPKLYTEFTVNGSTYASVALLQAALVDVIYTRDTLGNGGTGVWGTITGDITNQDDLMALLPQGQAPIENIYTTVAELLADQGNQTQDFLNLVKDASDDPTVTSGRAYYQKLIASTGSLDDYYKLSDGENASLEAWQGKVKIQGFWFDTQDNTNLFDIEVGNAFDGFDGNRYVVGKVLQVPLTLPADLDDPTKVRLFIDNE